MFNIIKFYVRIKFMKINRIFLIFFSAFLLLMISSCATTVNVQLTRPAQLDLNGARTIAVLPFKPYSYYKEYDTAIGREILVNSFYQIFDIKDPDEQLIIDTLHGQIEHGILESPYIKLVSSESVERALSKRSLNPADVYLTGEVSYFDVIDRRKEKKERVRVASGDQKAEYIFVTYWSREVYFNFRYQVVDSSNDTVIASEEFRCSRYSSDYHSRNALPGAYSIIESDIRSASRQILHELQPYTVTKSIKLLEAKTKDKDVKERMKAAGELVKNYKLEQACKEYADIYQDTKLVEAGYNHAVLMEAQGELSAAEEIMQDIYDTTSDPRLLKGLEDIRYEINQAKRLNKQIKDTDISGDLDGIDDFEDLDDLDF